MKVNTFIYSNLILYYALKVTILWYLGKYITCPVAGISLKFEGNSRVQFEEMSQKRTDKGTENKTTTYIATEKYYKSKFLVWSGVILGRRNT